MAQDDKQEIPQSEKENPALAATREAQDMSTLNKIVIPPGAYTDPSNPAAASGSVNMSVETHPSLISEDYGQDVLPGEHNVSSPIDTHADMLQLSTDPDAEGQDRPDDRDQWKKADWVAQAKEYDLTSSGNTDEVKKRVEDYEAAVKEAKDWHASDWQQEITDTANTADLDDLRALYSHSGADYSTVVEAFDTRAAELNQS